MEQVLRLRFGINTRGRKMTRPEIVRHLDISLPQVQNSEKQALHKIRSHTSRKTFLASFLAYPVRPVFRREVRVVTYDELLNLKALAQAARTIEKNQDKTLSAPIFGYIEQAHAPIEILAAQIASKTKGRGAKPVIRQDLMHLLEIAQNLRSAI
jgi:hypothetical protein